MDSELRAMLADVAELASLPVEPGQIRARKEPHAQLVEAKLVLVGSYGHVAHQLYDLTTGKACGGWTRSRIESEYPEVVGNISDMAAYFKALS
jgi:hypothetical protein